MYLRHSLVKVKAQLLPAQIAPHSQQATKQAASCCARGCLWQSRQSEQPARFERVMTYELCRLLRMAEGGPDEQPLQAVAQQSSLSLLLRSAMTLLSSLQQTPVGQFLLVKAIHWQAGPQGPAQGVWPGGRVRIWPAEHSILHALLSGLGLSTKALRQALPSPTLFQTEHQPIWPRKLLVADLCL